MNCGDNNTHNSDKCYHLHPELCPGKNGGKKEVNFIDKASKTEEEKLCKIIAGLTKQVKEYNESKEKKSKRKKQNTDISEEEMAYRRAMTQMAETVEDSDTDSE